MRQQVIISLLGLSMVLSLSAVALGQTRQKQSAAKQQAPSPAAPVAVVNNPEPDYLSGEVKIEVSGNSNPLIRLGLAQNGVTLVEFPASDRFFALHPGNSDLVTIDDSPTKAQDHFFVLRAGSGLLPLPAEMKALSPATSIVVQMQSGMVVTLLIYPVRELAHNAHCVVVTYDRESVVSARRAAGLAINLGGEESPAQSRTQTTSIRIIPAEPKSEHKAAEEKAAPKTDPLEKAEAAAPEKTRAIAPGMNLPPSEKEVLKAEQKTSAQESVSAPELSANPVVAVLKAANGSSPDKETTAGKPAIRSEETPVSNRAKQPNQGQRSSKAKDKETPDLKWSKPLHGLSIMAQTQILSTDKRLAMVTVRNTLGVPVRVVPGQPELLVETLNDQGRVLQVEPVARLSVESSNPQGMIAPGTVVRYQIAYEALVLGAKQRLAVAVAQMNAADEPVIVELTAGAR